MVASEVRALAQRSATAAREIKVLIGQSVERVAAGAQRVDETGRAMDELVEQVRQVAAMLAGVGQRAGEQHTGIGRVEAAVAALDAMTHENASLVASNAAAARDLAQQAQALAAHVAVFRLATEEGAADDGMGAPAAAADRPHRPRAQAYDDRTARRHRAAEAARAA
ncbi:methyl-accepting chemotaxis protein I [Piscinibacter sakaiensis]|uniref:Methyl-accepting chemotaxis protein I n=1 Tax=Piscinibacter sakaiensis TaxID=1547922 RepID=A0A0K8NY93_PISS1|nr:methyl-accepting chemotaxis protein I [Piscinibacter sakaiensis]